MKIKTLKGLALQDVLTEVHLYVHRGQSINLLFFFIADCKCSLFGNMKCSKCVVCVAFPNMRPFHIQLPVFKESPVLPVDFPVRLVHSGFNCSLARKAIDDFFWE